MLGNTFVPQMRTTKNFIDVTTIMQFRFILFFHIRAKYKNVFLSEIYVFNQVSYYVLRLKLSIEFYRFILIKYPRHMSFKDFMEIIDGGNIG